MLFLPGGPGVIGMVWARVTTRLLRLLADTGFTVRRLKRRSDLTAVFTRSDLLVNQRIVDHSSQGPVFKHTFELGATGTTLTTAWDSTRLDKVLDAIWFHGDRLIEEGHAAIKQEIEALP